MQLAPLERVMGLRTAHSDLELRFRDIEAPVALCFRTGEIEAATGQAFELLQRVKVIDGLPAKLPPELWAQLERVTAGEAVEWRPPSDGQSILGCTRYHVGDRYLLLMKEVSHKHAALSRRLHSQRLEATGRLVASVAHELRNAVASIVYSAELLEMADMNLPAEAIRQTLEEMVAASKQLQSSVDSLLGYARLGPNVSTPVSLREVMTRAQGFLRSSYREGRNKLVVDIAPVADWVQGNTHTIEQIFVNLLLNASEASKTPIHVRVFSDLAPMPHVESREPTHVRVRVWDDGPGVPDAMRQMIFQPFYSTRDQGTGLGLTIAIEAARSLNGTLVLEDRAPGACFAVYLPRNDDHC
jgi:signal transduction histidine kinase